MVLHDRSGWCSEEVDVSVMRMSRSTPAVSAVDVLVAGQVFEWVGVPGQYENETRIEVGSLSASCKLNIALLDADGEVMSLSSAPLADFVAAVEAGMLRPVLSDVSPGPDVADIDGVVFDPEVRSSWPMPPALRVDPPNTVCLAWEDGFAAGLAAAERFAATGVWSFTS